MKTMRRAPHASGLGNQPADDPRMAAMHAVVVADRDGSRAEFVGQVRQFAKEFHALSAFRAEW